MYKASSRNLQRRRTSGKTKHGRTTGGSGLYELHPVNKLASRAIGRPRKPKPKLGKLRNRAARTSDPAVRDALLQQVAAAEARSRAAEKAANRRLTGAKAIEKAKRALERAAWLREHR